MDPEPMKPKYEAIEPCPFCPGDKRPFVFPSGDVWFVVCPNCHARGPWADTLEGAKEKWNQAHPTDPPRERNREQDQGA